MKVLERKDWSNWRWCCVCPKCQSKLEADPSDIVCNLSSGGNPHDYCPEHFHVVCAVCMQHISVRESDIPAYLQDQARSRARNSRSGAYDR